MPCKAVINKMSLDLKKLETILTSKRIILKKIINVWKGKREFAKIKGSICNIPIERSIYMQYFAKTCRFKQIDCGEIKTRFSVQGLCIF